MNEVNTMVCPRCGVWRTLDRGVEFCLDCGEVKVLHQCPRCQKPFTQISGRFHDCGAKLVNPNAY